MCTCIGGKKIVGGYGQMGSTTNINITITLLLVYYQLLYNKKKTMLILETFQMYEISPHNLFFQDQENEYKGGPLEGLEK